VQLVDLAAFSGMKKDLGITITVEHGNGYSTIYAHLSRSIVKVGDVVERGRSIGMVGMTGNTTGPHLHYEVIKDGDNVNPEEYFIN
jgi:murein DD-endopeptidase MepM/ murein hydrolase activator NlpD